MKLLSWHIRVALGALTVILDAPVSAGDGAIVLGPRTIPVSGLISSAARKSVEDGVVAKANRPSGFGSPATSADKALWKQVITATDAAFAPMVRALRAHARASVQKTEMAGVPVYVGTPLQPRKDRLKRAILHVHGGGFAMLADGSYAEAMAAQIATRCGCTVYSVNYRAPPDFPYPTPVDDSLSVYRTLLKTMNPADIVVQGESAGGTIATSMVLQARDMSLPMPAILVLLSPALDLSRSGDSHFVNEGLDLSLSRSIASLIDLYAAGNDLKSPSLSPLFSDFSKGFPSTFLQAGGREILLSDSIAMHRALRRAGIPAELHIWEGMSHGPFGSPAAPAPEDDEVSDEIERFLEAHWSPKP